jgi:hypothetical protein
MDSPEDGTDQAVFGWQLSALKGRVSTKLMEQPDQTEPRWLATFGLTLFAFQFACLAV